MSEFFEPPPPPPTPRARARVAPGPDRLGPPGRTAPAVVPAERVIARTDEVAISLSRLWVYPTGLELSVSVDAGDEWTDLDPFDDARRRRGPGIRDASPEERLLLGFQFADGSRVTTLGDGPGPVGEPGAESPMLLPRGGRSGGGHWDQRYWLWPLPPPGQLSFVCRWPAAGIPLTRVDLDAAEIIEASSRSRAIFPDRGEATE